MIVASAGPLPVGHITDGIYEGPETDSNPTQIRFFVIRIATRDEYVEYGREAYGEKFSIDEDLRRGWNHYYQVSMD